jgi:drug/metabolite transporter (DMT)-like permease
MMGIFFKLPLPKGRALLGSVIYGALNFGGGYSFIYYSLGKVKPGMATVILALVPLFTFILAILHRQESFHFRALFGTLLAAGELLSFFVSNY